MNAFAELFETNGAWHAQGAGMFDAIALVCRGQV
jgi:hypothetical protein